MDANEDNAKQKQAKPGKFPEWWKYPAVGLVWGLAASLFIFNSILFLTSPFVGAVGGLIGGLLSKRVVGAALGGIVLVFLLSYFI